MTIVKHELKQGKNSFLIWTAAIAMLLAVCVFLFPEMKGEMDGISDIFASMGSFTSAFGMDRLNFGTLVGFYAIAVSYTHLDVYKRQAVDSPVCLCR